MDQNTNRLSSDDKAALGQLEQRASNLHQSSSNNFLVSLEGLMLSAIAWESIGKGGKQRWISPVSKVTTAIGLAVAGIFGANAMRDHAKAQKIDSKLKQYGITELTLPSEMPTAIPATAPVKHSVPFMDAAAQPQTSISTQGAELARMQPELQLSV